MKRFVFVLVCILIIYLLVPIQTAAVDLEWDANPPEDNVDGYHIYRATQQGPPYVKINAGAITFTQYTDSTIQPSVRYWYVATAENSSGESGFSNEVDYCIALGDANRDGSRNIFDVITTMNHVVGNTNLVGDMFLAADVNQDSSVNIFDVVQLQNHIVGNILLQDCP
jgi:hypothetical protein